MARSDTEPEVRMYWTLMRQYNFLVRAEMAYPEDARQAAEEFEVLADYTSNLRLRRLCLAAAAMLVPTVALADVLEDIVEIVVAVEIAIMVAT